MFPLFADARSGKTVYRILYSQWDRGPNGTDEALTFAGQRPVPEAIQPAVTLRRSDGGSTNSRSGTEACCLAKDNINWKC